VIDKTSGVTKLELAEHQALVAEWALPYLVKRPLALVRCPDGDAGECFFQKQRTPGMPASIHAGKVGKHGVIWIEDLAGMVSLAQFGAVELHGWGSRMPDPDRPDWIVMDFDPDPKVPFTRVVDAARTMKDALLTLGLESFVKTTGGKGLHVVAPIEPEHDFEAIKALTKTIATTFATSHPDRYTDVMSKVKRSGRIFVDYLRNGHGSTAIMPYSVRARPGAPVAWPIAWTELDGLDPSRYTVRSAAKLLSARRSDPWADLSKLRQKLPKLGKKKSA
jgi:bifunctional non-homologous end joining protein LigD